MPDALYDTGRQYLIDNDEINWEDDLDIFCHLCSGYAHSVAHTWLADVSGVGGGTIVKSSPALTGKAQPSGCLRADNTSFPSVTGPVCQSIVIAKGDPAQPSTAKLIHYLDGLSLATIATTASGTVTAIQVDPLRHAIGTGTVMNKIAGTGPAQLTVTAAYSVGQRNLLINSVTGPINQGATYSFAYQVNGGVSGLPVTPDGNNINLTWNATSPFIVRV
jgi:hypothetical protein